MHILDNLVLHYLYNMTVGLVIYYKARAFKAKSKSSRRKPRTKSAKAKRFGLKAKEPEVGD